MICLWDVCCITYSFFYLQRFSFIPDFIFIRFIFLETFYTVFLNSLNFHVHRIFTYTGCKVQFLHILYKWERVQLVKSSAFQFWTKQKIFFSNYGWLFDLPKNRQYLFSWSLKNKLFMIMPNLKLSFFFFGRWLNFEKKTGETEKWVGRSYFFTSCFLENTRERKSNTFSYI
jgi:hypothetical protein